MCSETLDRHGNIDEVFYGKKVDIKEHNSDTIIVKNYCSCLYLECICTQNIVNNIHIDRR